MTDGFETLGMTRACSRLECPISRGVEGSKELMQENALLVFTQKKKMDRMGFQGKIAYLREIVPHLTSSWGRQGK